MRHSVDHTVRPSSMVSPVYFPVSFRVKAALLLFCTQVLGIGECSAKHPTHGATKVVREAEDFINYIKDVSVSRLEVASFITLSSDQVNNLSLFMLGMSDIERDLYFTSSIVPERKEDECYQDPKLVTAFPETDDNENGEGLVGGLDWLLGSEAFNFTTKQKYTFDNVHQILPLHIDVSVGPEESFIFSRTEPTTEVKSDVVLEMIDSYAISNCGGIPVELLLALVKDYIRPIDESLPMRYKINSNRELVLKNTISPVMGNPATCYGVNFGLWCVPKAEWPVLLPLQSADCYDPQRKSVTYVGNVSTTRSGKTCKYWDDMDDQKHYTSFWYLDNKYHLAENNFCRYPAALTPEGADRVPWCYVDGPPGDEEECDDAMRCGVAWEECDVPVCTHASCQADTRVYSPAPAEVARSGAPEESGGVQGRTVTAVPNVLVAFGCVAVFGAAILITLAIKRSRSGRVTLDGARKEAPADLELGAAEHEERVDPGAGHGFLLPPWSQVGQQEATGGGQGGGSRESIEQLLQSRGSSRESAKGSPKFTVREFNPSVSLQGSVFYEDTCMYPVGASSMVPESLLPSMTTSESSQEKGAGASTETESASEPSPSGLGDKTGTEVVLDVKEVLAGVVDHVELLEVIGRGSFGQVYKAMWNGVLVAVKIIEVVATKSQYQTILKELELSKLLRHPNILNTFASDAKVLGPKTVQFANKSVDLHHMQGFLLLEYSAVGDLVKACRVPHLQLDPSHCQKYYHLYLRVAGLLLDIANGVSHMHSRNIVHCDLKLENIFCFWERRKAPGRGGEGEESEAGPGLAGEESMEMIAKVGDFGLSRIYQAGSLHSQAKAQEEPPEKRPEQHSERPMLGRMVGTPTHSAPEAMLRGPSCMSPASDVFAFGVILWQMVSKCKPFDGWQVEDVVQYVAIEDKRLQLTPAVCPCHRMRGLMDWCFKRDPQERPSFPEIVKYLQEYQSDLRDLIEELHAQEGCVCSSLSHAPSSADANHAARQNALARKPTEGESNAAECEPGESMEGSAERPGNLDSAMVKLETRD